MNKQSIIGIIPIIILTLIIIGMSIILVLIDLKISEDKNLQMEDVMITESVNIEVNSWEYISANDEDIINIYFSKYIDSVKNNLENSYNLLDEEYREKKFENIDNYKKYISNNKFKLTSAIITEYKINKYDNYTQYILIDKNGNNYIINETATMQFSVMLDTYTIDLPEFIEQYDWGNDKKKISLNLEKILQAINDNDYNYLYNKLNSTFKDNNFTEINKFEEYIQNIFYNKNTIEKISYQEEGDVYICTLNLSNTKNNNDNIKQVTMMIKLIENRDFVISFVL